MSDIYQISESDWGWHGDWRGVTVRILVIVAALMSGLYLFQLLSAIIQHRAPQFNFDWGYLIPAICADAAVEWFGSNARMKFEIEFNHGRLGFRRLGESQPNYFNPEELRVRELAHNLLWPTRIVVSERGWRKRSWSVPNTLPQFQELKVRLQQFAA